jgi:hypothetical protein
LKSEQVEEVEEVEQVKEVEVFKYLSREVMGW